MSKVPCMCTPEIASQIRREKEHLAQRNHDMHVRAQAAEAENHKLRRALVQAHRWIGGARGYPEDVRAREATRIIREALGGIIA